MTFHPPDAPAEPLAAGTPAPLLVILIGDSPRQPSGLGRLARDIGEVFAALAEPLHFDLVQFGWEDAEADFDIQPNYKFVPFQDLGRDWAAGHLAKLVEREQLRRGMSAGQVVVMHLWDPARCFDYASWPWWKWGYFAIDGHNPKRTIGGPAGEVLTHWNRALAYTRYGLGILTSLRTEGVAWLPHGIWWQHQDSQPVSADPPPLRLGCVAANQPRKDLGLYFQVLAELRRRNPEWEGWLHTDRLVTGAWSIPELCEVYEIPPAALEITLTLSEAQLAQHYQGCAVTLAPGRGEGFGYPIVESLACGVPCLHMAYAGGAELLPEAWRLEYDPATTDYTNPYLIGRPRLAAMDVVHAVEGIMWDYWDTRQRGPQATRLFCHGAVRPYYWSEILPAWQEWIARGLGEVRRSLQQTVAAVAVEADPRD